MLDKKLSQKQFVSIMSAVTITDKDCTALFIHSVTRFKKNDNLENFPSWWAATVATYCPSKPGELPKFSSSEPHDSRPR